MLGKFRLFIGLALSLLVAASFQTHAQTACCPKPKGDWKNDPATPGCVADILKKKASRQPAVTLAQQWIAAVYNFADCPPVDNHAEVKELIVAMAPSLLGLEIVCCYSLPDLCNVQLPNVPPNSEPGSQMLAVASVLESYNKGFFNDCDGDGFTTSQGDCDDSNASIRPGAEEVVDGVDNNCNGQIDEDACPCPYPDLPNPELTLESVATVGNFVRYELNVQNYEAFPDCLFAPTAEYGACGANTTPSRTWVDIYDAADDSYIFGFCALYSPTSLDNIWFAIPLGTTPPEQVYVEMTDRKCGQAYRSQPISVGF